LSRNKSCYFSPHSIPTFVVIPAFFCHCDGVARGNLPPLSFFPAPFDKGGHGGFV
jgi:hypothetical protein